MNEEVGSNSTFTGTQKGLSVLDDQVYAYNLGAAATEFEGLKFTTGKYFIKCRIYCLYDADDIGNGNQFGYKYEMNGIQISHTRRQSSASDIIDAPLPAYVDLIIPPNTEFVATSFTNASSVDTTFLLTDFIHGR